MTPPHLTESEKHRLLCEWQAGVLSDQDANKLLTAACADATLREEMAGLQKTERLLRHHGVTADGDLFAEEVVARLQEEQKPERSFASAVIVRLGAKESRSTHWWNFASRPILVAVALVLVLLSTTVLWQTSLPAGLATVVALEAVQWGQPENSLKVGVPIQERAIEISSGFLSIKFASGATAILEGPARLDVLTRNSARLWRGKIVANVPDSAKGFTLESPEGRIIDLGTRFGVEVDDRGDTEVHVLQGLVRTVVRGETKARELHRSQGLRMSPGKAVSIEADQSRFLTALPQRPSGRLSFVHWSFDEGKGNVAHDSGVKLGGGKADGKLASLQVGGNVPTWVAGRFGGGIEFDGIDNYIATRFNGIGGGQPRTVAFWVRVPKDWAPRWAYAVVNWGSFKTPGAAWQISVNPEAKDGPIGRLRVGIKEASVIGSRDLRDGEWHHIAAVLYSSEELRDTTQILLYVDGELEPAYRRSILEVQTGEPPDASSVSLGRNLNPKPPTGQRVFRGAVDEVYIINGALPREAVQRLMRENKLGRM